MEADGKGRVGVLARKEGALTAGATLDPRVAAGPAFPRSSGLVAQPSPPPAPRGELLRTWQTHTTDAESDTQGRRLRELLVAAASPEQVEPSVSLEEDGAHGPSAPDKRTYSLSAHALSQRNLPTGLRRRAAAHSLPLREEGRWSRGLAELLRLPKFCPAQRPRL
ncbi:uncharacterized protein LOC108310897 [Cebus imitator]|uniref:uncharacterized protein LOC108310897 n=1 Tax=Cebus imitator TaxID=2715852 RepID=UPI000809E719|nr:uncharacterized protein LOC108310897 [Cebus imitator]